MWIVGGLVLLTLIVCGCSPDVSREPAVDAGTSSTGSGGADAGTADAADADVEWTHDPGKTFSSVSCKDDGMMLFVEAWPGEGVLPIAFKRPVGAPAAPTAH